MWVRSAAIRPIPPYAELSADALSEAEIWLSGGEALDERQAESRLQEAFERFERRQPALAERIGGELSRTADEVAVALGFYLSSLLWLSFEQCFDKRLARVSETAVASVDQSLKLDEELRGADPVEAVDSDDVVAMEQPHALDLIQEHVEAALEAHAEAADVDAVHRVYRLLLVQVLALSYAVLPPDGTPPPTGEICA